MEFGLIDIILREKYKDKLKRILLIVAMIIVFPIGINVMNLIVVNTTMNLVTGTGILTTLLLIILVYRKLQKSSFNSIIKCYIIMMLAILSYTFILQNTYTYMCRQKIYENYYVVSNNIYNRATILEGYSEDKKWMFSDVIRYTPEYADRANGFISNDNETWDNYDGTRQNARFFEKYFGINIEICSEEEYKEIVKTEEFQEMPIYPNNGSIRIIDNIIVIKVSEEIYE